MSATEPHQPMNCCSSACVLAPVLPFFYFLQRVAAKQSVHFLSTAAFKGNGSPINEHTDRKVGQTMGSFAADKLWVFPEHLSSSRVWKSECRESRDSSPVQYPLSLVRVESFLLILPSCLPNSCMYTALTSLPPPFQSIAHTRWNMEQMPG